MPTYSRPCVFAALLFLAGAAKSAFAASDPLDPTPTYTWVPLSECRLPKRSPPPLPHEDYFLYNAQRRFLDLDRDGQCVVMDFWLERFRSMPNSVTRIPVQRFYRFNGKRWVKFSTVDLKFFPYALQSADGATVFVEAAVTDDVSDQVALGTIEPHVFQTAPGKKGLFGPVDGAGFADLTPYPGDTRPILLALARILSERLESGQTFEEERLTVQREFRTDRRAEIARIDMLTKAANHPVAKKFGPVE